MPVLVQTNTVAYDDATFEMSTVPRMPSSKHPTLRPMRSAMYSRNARGVIEAKAAMAKSEDPLSFALHPPSDETQEEQQAREQLEAAAKKRNEDIERQIREDAGRLRGERSAEKTILLLGQSEAGKTTILKQMRMMYDPERQARLREAWIDVIYLNVVLTVKALVSAHHQMHQPSVDRHQSPTCFPTPPTSFESPPMSPTFSASPCSSPAQRALTPFFSGTMDNISERIGKELPAAPSPVEKEGSVNRSLLSRLRLAPLLSTESELRSRLGAFDEPQQRKEGNKAKRNSYLALTQADMDTTQCSTLMLKSTWQEDYLNTHDEQSVGIKDTDSMIDQTFVMVNAAKRTVSTLMRPSSKAGRQASAASQNRPTSKSSTRSPLDVLIRPSSSSKNGKKSLPVTEPMINNADRSKTSKEHIEEQEKMQRLLEACVPEVQELWLELQAMQGGLQLLQSESASYFLDHLPRISQAGYCPTDDDILRARVRTAGVYEERFAVDKLLKYRIIDVGGSRTQRNVWAQFFSDATAIIFLAPVSTFDEKLAEDKQTNKLKDSIQLWESVVSSPLLKQVSLILFLNKVDILKNKLKAGKLVKNHFARYTGDNSFECVLRFFRTLFKAMYNKHQTSQSSRSVYVYKTTATSTREVRTILSSCQDIIVKQHLRDSALT